MELERLAPLFMCPACGRAGSSLDGDRAGSDSRWGRERPQTPGSYGALVCDGCGARYSLCNKSVQTTRDVALSDTWTQKQVEGESRYRDESYHADDTIDRLFGGFIAATVDKRSVVLDVGCGIREEPPPYVSELDLENYLGLEPLAVATPRSYACLAGAVVEKIPLVTGAAGAMIFATSLDHIEHLGPAFKEASRVLARGASLYFWVGLYEPEIMAKSSSYHHTLFSGSWPKRIARFALLHLVYARFVQLMLFRKYKLWRKIPLDEKHFRYYTRASLTAEIEKHGMTILRKLVVPGSNSMFVEARFSR
jgi:hypothetical protein